MSRQRSGCIINIVDTSPFSRAQRQGQVGRHAVAKFGLEGLTQALEILGTFPNAPPREIFHADTIPRPWRHPMSLALSN